MAKSKSRAKPRRVSSGGRKAASQPKVARKVPGRGRANVGIAAKGKPTAKLRRIVTEQALNSESGDLRNSKPVIAAGAGSGGDPKVSSPKAAAAGVGKAKGLQVEAPKVPVGTAHGSRRQEPRRPVVPRTSDARSGGDGPVAGRLAAATQVVAAARAINGTAVGGLEAANVPGSRGPAVASSADASRETALPAGLPVPIASFTI